MSDPLTWAENNFATLVLAAFTAVLAYFTLAMKKATDHFARTSILPRLVVETVYRIPGKRDTAIIVKLANRGPGIAVNVQLWQGTPTGPRFKVERHTLTFTSLASDEADFYDTDIPIGSRELDFNWTFEDAEGFQYEGKQLVPLPPPLSEASS